MSAYRTIFKWFWYCNKQFEVSNFTVQQREVLSRNKTLQFEYPDSWSGLNEQRPVINILLIDSLEIGSACVWARPCEMNEKVRKFLRWCRRWDSSKLIIYPYRSALFSQRLNSSSILWPWTTKWPFRWTSSWITLVSTKNIRSKCDDCIHLVFRCLKIL